MRHVPLLTAGLILATATLPVPARAGAGLPKIANLQAGPHTASLHNDSPVLVAGSNLLTLEIPSLPSDRVVSLTLEGPNGRQLVVPLQTLTVLSGPGATETHGVSLIDHDAAHGLPALPSGTHDTDHSAANAGHETTLPASMAGMDHSTMAGHAAPTAAVAAPQPAASHHAAGVDAGAGTTAAPAPRWSRPTGAAAVASQEPHSDVADEVAFAARGAVHLDYAGSWLARLEIRTPSGERLIGESRLDAVDTGPSAWYLATTGTLIGGALLVGATQRHRRPGRARGGTPR